MKQTRYEILKLEIGKLEMKSGDILVVRFPDINVSDGKVRETQQELSSLLPPGTAAMLFVGDIKIDVISKENQ